MKVNVRRPTIEDYPDAERLMQQVHALHVAWRPDIFKSVETVLTRAMFEHDLANDTAFIAEVEGQAVGLMRINRFETGNFLTMNRKVLFIDAMVVDEAFRKQGIGTALLDFLKEMKKIEGFDAIELQVAARNESARALYADAGFVDKAMIMELTEDK